jgi:hypothetical protein
MTPNAENQEEKLVYGMRGGIPSDRMEQIHLGLPYSITLRDVFPYLADPLAPPLVRIGEMQARVRLSNGWHMLNQARIALVEAEACTLFYEECQHNHTEALYRCQYYLDDAALRLHSIIAASIMLRSVAGCISFIFSKRAVQPSAVNSAHVIERSSERRHDADCPLEK